MSHDQVLNSARPKLLGQQISPKEFFKFCDLLGSWQHCTYPMNDVDDSWIRGWHNISQSDMVAVGDPSTVCLDPFFESPTII